MRKLIGTLSLIVTGLFTSQIAKADACNGFSTARNLVTNCSFETGTFSGWSGTSTTDSNSGVDTFAPYAGSYEAFLGGAGAPFTLSQTLNTTAGSLYSVIFAVMNDTTPSTGYLNSFQALFGSTTLLSESAVLAGGYIVYNYTGIATGSSTTLSFVSRNDAAVLRPRLGQRRRNRSGAVQPAPPRNRRSRTDRRRPPPSQNLTNRHSHQQIGLYPIDRGQFALLRVPIPANHGSVLPTIDHPPPADRGRHPSQHRRPIEWRIPRLRPRLGPIEPPLPPGLEDHYIPHRPSPQRPSPG